MQTFSFYDARTGLFTGSTYSTTTPSELAMNTPAGQVAIAGAFDHLSQRVVLETGAVVDWVPPPPSSAHTWSPETRRWTLPAAAADADRRRAAARSRIRDLEAAQARPLRELAIDPHDLEARRRLQAIDEEITAARVALRNL